MNDSINVKGTLKIIVSDEHNNVKAEYDYKNLVVTAGKTFIINALKASSTSPFSYIAVGTGSTAPASGDTALQTELVRVATTNTTTATSVTYTAVFGSGVGTGAITEAGILNNSVGGTMLSRTVFSTINKGSPDTLTIVWTISLS